MCVCVCLGFIGYSSVDRKGQTHIISTQKHWWNMRAMENGRVNRGACNRD